MCYKMYIPFCVQVTYLRYRLYICHNTSHVVLPTREGEEERRKSLSHAGSWCMLAHIDNFNY